MKRMFVAALCFLLLSSTVTASVSCDGFTRGESTETKTEEATEPAKPTESDAQTDSPDASEAPTSTDIPMESEKVTESETSVDTVAPTESEKVTESDTFAVTDTPTESETVTVTETLAETETETHEHNFDIKDTSEKYLKSEATCTKPAYYYYSCSCGEKGSNYYKSGKANGHVYDQKDTSDKYVKIAESCTKRGLYYYSCKCGAKGEDTFNGDAPKGHVFDQKNTSAKYVKYAPTCTKYGLYYYSCVCGEKGEKTFNGTELGHVFDIMNTDEKYLKTPATESSAAVYYYSCSCGAKGEKTFKGTLNIETCNHSFKYGRGVKYDESSGCNVSYDAYFCSLCSLEVIEHGNYYMDSVKYYVTGDCVNLKDFKIVIYGTGGMPNATPDARPMWEDYYCYETEIIIRDGITSIGDYTFYSRNPHEYITFTIADTVSYVGRYGLYLDTENLVLGRGIKSLDINSIGCVQNAIFLPRSIEYIRGRFTATVFYEGSREEFYNIKTYYHGEWITIGEFAEKEDSYDIAYFIYLNASGIGDRDHYLDWAE